MSNIRVYAIVEGKTEKSFIDEVVAPALWPKGVYMEATIAKKTGENGGDIKFVRIQKDIGNFLKQRPETYVTLLVDFYGIKDPNSWPGLSDAKQKTTPADKAGTFNEGTRAEISSLFPEHNARERFLPYVSMHEFEALLFSSPQVLADKLAVCVSKINQILSECGSPEGINDSALTAPSKRIAELNKSFKKTSTGIAIAKEIGIDTIRANCPIFNNWISQIESLAENPNG